jgi:hypothetical protein
MATSVVAPGQTPGTFPLVIGAVEFNSSETPTTLPIGVEQMTTTHTLVGGTRVVQTFGVSPKEVTWTGRFFDLYQQVRVSQLRLYASAGTPVLLTWKGQEAYEVIVKDFTPTFRANYVEYSITVIVTNPVGGAYKVAATQTVQTQVDALNTTANTLTASLVANDPTGSSAVQTAMAGVNNQLSQATPDTLVNPVLSKPIQTSISTASQATAAYQATLTSSSSLLPTTIQLQGTLQAMLQNLTTGSSSQVLQTQGGNLFQIASQYYGDVSQGFTLASASSLASAFLPSATFTNVSLLPLSSQSQSNYTSVLGT